MIVSIVLSLLIYSFIKGKKFKGWVVKYKQGEEKVNNWLRVPALIVGTIVTIGFIIIVIMM